jgi:hypothetical protein
MTPEVVHDYLREIGSRWFGKGVAMELGCWLGASSYALLEGLVKAKYDRPFWAFDRWKATKYQVRKAGMCGEHLEEGQDLVTLYRDNVKAVYDKIYLIQGNIPNSLSKYSGDPIEICVFDAPKTNPVFIESITALERYFIPGVTILGLLDYYSYKKHEGPKREKFMAPVRFIESRGDCYSFLTSWPGECSCAFFKYEKDAMDS